MGAREDAEKLWERTFPKIVARAWTDPGFRKRLEKSPDEVFKEYELPVIPGATYEVKEGTPFSIHLKITIPPRPPDLREDSAEDVIIDVYRHAAKFQSFCTL